MKHCGAKTRAGGRCKKLAMPNGRCDMHGGKSPKGIASATFKHGLRSKYLPAHMQEKFQAAASDPELLRLEGDVALLEARLLELLERVGVKGASAESWPKLKALWQEFRSLKEGEVERGKEIMAAVGDEIGRGGSDAEAWTAVYDVIEQRRKVVDSIKRHQIQEHESLSLDRAMALFTALTQAVKQNVHDRVALNRISEQFARLMDRPEAKGLPGPVIDAEVEA